MVEPQLVVPLPTGVGVAVGISAASTNGAVGGVDAGGAVSAVGITLDECPSGVGQAHDGVLLVAMITRLRVFELARGRLATGPNRWRGR